MSKPEYHEMEDVYIIVGAIFKTFKFRLHFWQSWLPDEYKRAGIA